jgi:hypothetical protein
VGAVSLCSSGREKGQEKPLLCRNFVFLTVFRLDATGADVKKVRKNAGGAATTDS